MENLIITANNLYDNEWEKILTEVIKHYFNKEHTFTEYYLGDMMDEVAAFFKSEYGIQVNMSEDNYEEYYNKKLAELNKHLPGTDAEEQFCEFEQDDYEIEEAVFEVLPLLKGVLDTIERSIKDLYLTDVIGIHYILDNCANVKARNEIQEPKSSKPKSDSDKDTVINPILDLETFNKEDWATVAKVCVKHIFNEDLDLEKTGYGKTVYRWLTEFFKTKFNIDFIIDEDEQFHKQLRQKYEKLIISGRSTDDLEASHLENEELKKIIFNIMPEFTGLLDESRRQVRESWFSDLATAYYILLKCKEAKKVIDSKANATKETNTEKRFKEKIKIYAFNFQRFKEAFTSGFGIELKDIERFIKGSPGAFNSPLVSSGLKKYNWTPFFHIAVSKALINAHNILECESTDYISQALRTLSIARAEQLRSNFKKYTKDNNIEYVEESDDNPLAKCYVDDLITFVCINELITIVQENIKYEKCEFKGVNLNNITKDTKFSELGDAPTVEVKTDSETKEKPFISLKDVYACSWDRVTISVVRHYLGIEVTEPIGDIAMNNVLRKFYKRYIGKDLAEKHNISNFSAAKHSEFSNLFKKEGKVVYELSNLKEYTPEYSVDELVGIVNLILGNVFDKCFTEAGKTQESSYFDDLIKTAYIVDVVKEIKDAKEIKEGKTTETETETEKPKSLSIEEIRTKNAHIANALISHPVCKRLSLGDFGNLLSALLVGNYYKKETKKRIVTTAVDWKDVKSVSLKSLLNTPNESYDFTDSKLGKRFWEKVADRIGEFENKVHATFKAAVADKDKIVTKADVQNLYTSIYDVQLQAYIRSVHQEVQNIKRLIKSPHHTVIRNMLKHFNMYEVFLEDMKVVYEYKDEQAIVKDWENRKLFFEYEIPLYLLDEKCPHKELWEKFQPIWKNIYTNIYSEFRIKYGKLLIENFQKPVYTLMQTKIWNNINDKYSFSSYVEQEPNDIMSGMLPLEMLNNGLQPKIMKPGENERKSAVIEMSERSLRFKPVIKFVF